MPDCCQETRELKERGDDRRTDGKEEKNKHSKHLMLKGGSPAQKSDSKCIWI